MHGRYLMQCGISHRKRYLVLFIGHWLVGRAWTCPLLRQFLNAIPKKIVRQLNINPLQWAVIGWGWVDINDFANHNYSGKDWLWKQANIKVENNGAVVYVGSSLIAHNPLLFVYKLWLNKLIRCFYWSARSKWEECYWTLCTVRSEKANKNI